MSSAFSSSLHSCPVGVESRRLTVRLIVGFHMRYCCVQCRRVALHVTMVTILPLIWHVSMAVALTHDISASSQPLLSFTATCHTGPKDISRAIELTKYHQSQPQLHASIEPRPQKIKPPRSLERAWSRQHHKLPLRRRRQTSETHLKEHSGIPR